MSGKLILCKSCGKEIAKSAKTCPHCGARNKKSFWKVLLIVVGIIIVISFIAGLSGGSKGSENSTAVTTESTAEAQPQISSPATAEKEAAANEQKAAPAAEIKIDARKLYEDYEANQLKADKQYKGKTLQITGTVADITKSWTDEYYVEIAGTSDYQTVNVYFRKSELDKITDLDKGQTVTVLGRCEGYDIHSVKIEDAYLVQ